MADGGLANRVGIVTGAASGIGEATAHRLLRDGARLTLADTAWRNAETEADPVDEAGSVVYETADVRSFDEMCRVANRCRDRFGRIDFLVANAGVGEAGSLADGDPERWRTVIDTNLLGLAHVIRAVLPIMRDQAAGHVVVVASLSGRIAYLGEPIYAASKWGAVGLGQMLRKEASRYGLRTTIVEPGLVDTALSRSSPLGREELARVHPLSPSDVSEVIAFALVQPSHVNVTEVVVQPTEEDF